MNEVNDGTSNDMVIQQDIPLSEPFTMVKDEWSQIVPEPMNMI